MDKQPQTLLEAVRYFQDKDVAHDFFVHLRWPNGVFCPRSGCGSGNPKYIKTRKTWQCRECDRQFTAKLGTIFEDSPIGFDKWLPAMWLIAAAKNGISSCEVARAIGVTQKTAWFMLHRIRLSMTAPDGDKLTGPVEADETYVGGKLRALRDHHGRAKRLAPGAGKTTVMGIVQRNEGDRKGRIRAFVVKDDGVPLADRLRQHVAPGETVYTDAAASYIKLKRDYTHFVINHAYEYVRGHVHTNSIEGFWSVFKRTIKGTYIAPRPWHLQRYVEEQVWRFNEREDNDGGRFPKAVRGADGRRLTYKSLTGKG